MALLSTNLTRYLEGAGGTRVSVGVSLNNDSPEVSLTLDGGVIIVIVICGVVFIIGFIILSIAVRRKMKRRLRVSLPKGEKEMGLMLKPSAPPVEEVRPEKPDGLLARIGFSLAKEVPGDSVDKVVGAEHQVEEGSCPSTPARKDGDGESLASFKTCFAGETPLPKMTPGTGKDQSLGFNASTWEEA